MQEFYAGLEDRKYLTLPDAQKKRLQVNAAHIFKPLPSAYLFHSLIAVSISWHFSQNQRVFWPLCCSLFASPPPLCGRNFGNGLYSAMYQDLIFAADLG